MSLVASFNSNHDKVMTFAKKVDYPYLLVLGEKDVIVCNPTTRKWHARTSTPAAKKEIKLMAGSYHELTKEPNNHVMFEAVMKFMNKRLLDGAKPFQKLSPRSDVHFSR